MTSPRVEKAYEKYAWIIPFAMGIVFLLFSIAAFLAPSLLTDAPLSAVGGITSTTFTQLAASNPVVVNYIYYLIRTFVFFGVVLFSYLTVVSATAYRRGERWAWYLTWLFPALFLLHLPYEFIVGGFIEVGSIIIVAILVAGLLLPYRKFFPKRHLEARAVG